MTPFDKKTLALTYSHFRNRQSIPATIDLKIIQLVTKLDTFFEAKIQVDKSK